MCLCCTRRKAEGSDVLWRVEITDTFLTAVVRPLSPPSPSQTLPKFLLDSLTTPPTPRRGADGSLCAVRGKAQERVALWRQTFAVVVESTKLLAKKNNGTQMTGRPGVCLRCTGRNVLHVKDTAVFAIHTPSTSRGVPRGGQIPRQHITKILVDTEKSTVALPLRARQTRRGGGTEVP